VVSDYTVERFAREFLPLHPDARLLVATKDGLARDRRKLLTGRMAGGEWDGILVTHSSFERIGLSKAYQERFLKEKIKEHNDLSAMPPGARRATSSSPSRSRRPPARSGSKGWPPRARRMTGWCSTSGVSITSY
jgi:N12 class adenine-specific DNA methylase